MAERINWWHATKAAIWGAMSVVFVVQGRAGWAAWFAALAGAFVVLALTGWEAE